MASDTSKGSRVGFSAPCNKEARETDFVVGQKGDFGHIGNLCNQLISHDSLISVPALGPVTFFS